MGKKIKTRIIHTGSEPKKHFGSISDPIYRNSTLIFESYKKFIEAKKNRFVLPYYGRISTYSTRSFEKVITSLYKSRHTILTSSGLSAITITLKSLLKSNDQILVTENCYEPVFNFSKIELSRFGIKTTFYPNNFKKLENLISKETKILYVESPSSLNYEVEDLLKITKIAKKNKIITVIDNTWSTFLGCNPLDYNFDIVIESATKYLSGHSDNFLGIITTKSDNLWKKIKQTSVLNGDFVSSESCFNAMKGLKTLEVRMSKHSDNAKKIFDYLNSKNSVEQIIYLPDPKNKNHDLWKKYHKISNGLITFSLKKKAKIELFLDKLSLFKIGFSWGGYESLILPLNNLKPSKKLATNSNYWFRIHIGLEDVNDLINDLERAIKNYEK